MSIDIDLFRETLIGRVGAFSVNHPGEKINYRELFPDMLRALKEHFYDSREGAIRQVEDDLLLVGTPAWEGLPEDRRDQAELTLANLDARYGYSREAALEMIGFAIKATRSDGAAPEQA